MKRHRTSLRDNRSPETAKPVIGLCLAAILAAAATPALANNSSAELGVGGILLTHSEGIELTSEDLFLSMDKVKVDYVFANTADKDIDIPDHPWRRRQGHALLHLRHLADRGAAPPGRGGGGSRRFLLQIEHALAWSAT